MVFKSYRTTCLHQQKTSNLLPHAKCLNLQVQEIANLDISITFEEKSMKKKLPLPLGSKSRLEPMPPMPACRYFHSPEEEAPENRADLATCCVTSGQWLPFWNCHWAFTALFLPFPASGSMCDGLHRNSTAGLCCTQQLRRYAALHVSAT